MGLENMRQMRDFEDHIKNFKILKELLSNVVDALI